VRPCAQKKTISTPWPKKPSQPHVGHISPTDWQEKRQPKGLKKLTSKENKKMLLEHLVASSQ
jgi:hypothetical protein